MTEETKKLTANDVYLLLEKRYPKIAYAIFPQVAKGTGSNVRNYADAIVMGLWPSRGLEVEGFEIKVARGDWLQELKRPDKANAICKYCNRWWIVAGSKDVVKLDELPKSWGLLVANGDCLRVAKQAPLLEPEQMAHSFVAAILRRAQDHQPSKEALKAEYSRGYEDGRKEEKRSQPYELRDLQRLSEKVKEFNEAAGFNAVGLDVAGWNGGAELGKACKIVLAGGHEKIADDLAWLERKLTTELDEIKKTIRDYKKLQGVCDGAEKNQA